MGEDLKEEEKNKEELEKIKKLLSDIKIDSELLETKQTKRKKVKHQELFQESSEIIKNVIFSDYSDENREIPKKEKKQINLENNELNSLKKSLKEKISILQEKNKLKINKLNDILKKKKKGLASISTMKPLKIFANEFKNSNIILELENSIPTYRQLKGDGNCFFRAAGFLFLESLFVEGMNPESGEMSPTKLNQFLEMLEKKNLELIDFKTETIDKDLIEIFQKEKNLLIEILELNLSEIFLKKLENIEINQFESNLGAIKDLEDKINENLAFDMSIICMIRSMIFSTCLLQKIDCSNHIETLHTYGREAEYQIVPFIIQILNLRINVYKLDFDDVKKKENLSVQKYGRIDDFKIKLVNFFFRPGHYEIGYDKEFLKEAYNLEF